MTQLSLNRIFIPWVGISAKLASPMPSADAIPCAKEVQSSTIASAVQICENEL